MFKNTLPDSKIGATICLMVFFLLIGCAAPYKLTPDFEANKEQIKTIAVFPLCFTDKGKEQCMFGTTFKAMFFDSLKTIPMTRPVTFLSPGETMALLEQAGITKLPEDTLVSETDTIFCFKPPTRQELKTVSEKAEAVLLCNLLNYNEVGTIVTAALLGAFGLQERNVVKMQFSLLDARSGKILWNYTPNFDAGSGGTGKDKMRASHVENIINGFRSYFPYSVAFGV